MAYGIQLFADDGSVTWDSTKGGGGVIVGTVVVLAGTSTVLTYPDFPGRTLFRITMKLDDYFYPGGPPVIDYNLGYPRITFSATTVTTTSILGIK